MIKEIIKEKINNQEKLFEYNKLYLQLIQDENFSELTVKDEEKYEKSLNYEIKTEYENKNIIDYINQKEIILREKETNEIIAIEKLNETGKKILEYYVKNQNEEIFKILTVTNISYIGIETYFQKKLNLTEISKWLAEEGIAKMGEKIYSYEYTKVFKNLEEQIIESDKKTLYEIKKNIPQIIKEIKKVDGEKNIQFNKILKNLLYTYIELMKKEIIEKNKKEYALLFKELLEIYTKNNIEIGMYDNHFNFLLNREEEYSKFKSLNSERIDEAFLALVENFTDEELKKIISEKGFYISGHGVNLEAIKEINYDNLSDYKKKIINLYSFNHVQDTEIYIKSLKDYLELQEYEKNQIVTNNSSSWNKIGNLAEEILKAKQEYILEILKKSNNEEKEKFKKRMRLSLSDFDIKEKLILESNLFKTNELYEIFIDKLKNFQEYGYYKREKNELIDNWIEYFISKGIKENKIKTDFLKLIGESKLITKYLLKNLDKYENIINQKKLIKKIKKIHSENQNIQKIIYEIENNEFSANTNLRKKLIDSNWRIENIYKENPEIFKEIFEELEKITKGKEENKVYIKNIIKIFRETIYTKKIPLDKYGKEIKNKYEEIYEYREVHKFDKTLLKTLINISKTEEIEEKLSNLKKAYLKIEKIKKENKDINDNIDNQTFEMFVAALFPEIKFQKWMANYLSNKRWDNMVHEGYFPRYDSNAKTNPDLIFEEKGIKFYYEIAKYLKNTEILSENFDLNEIMIENYYKIKNKSKEEKLKFIKDFEKYKKENRHNYENKNQDYFHKIFSWIILKGRLPKEEKIYDNIEIISNFDLSEYMKYQKLMKEIYQKLDRTTIKKILKYISKEEIKKEEEKKVIEEFIKENYNYMGLFNKYGIYSFNIIKKTLMDKTYSMLDYTIRDEEENNKYANYKDFELNYTNTIDFKQLQNYIDLKSFIEKIKLLPKGKEKYLEHLKIWEKILENNKTYSIIEFEKYMEEISENKEVSNSIKYDLLYILEIIKKRNYVDYTSMAKIFGNKIFEKNKESLRKNELNKIIEKFLLSEETIEIYENDTLDIKHGMDYIIKSKVVEILKNQEKIKEIINPEEIEKENEESKKEYFKTKEALEKKEKELEEKIQQEKEIGILDEWFSKEKSKYEKEEKLLKEKIRIEEKLKKENDKYEKIEGQKALKRIEAKIIIKKELENIDKLKDEIKKINYKEIKELTKDEIILYTYLLIKNKYVALSKIIKVLIEEKINEKEIYKIIKTRNYPKELEKQIKEIKNKEKQFKYIDEKKYNIDIRKSLLRSLNKKETKEKQLLEKLKIENDDYLLEIKGKADNITPHINRTKGMLNCATLSDIGENVIWTIMKNPQKNGMLSIKSKKDNKTVFTSYIKLLNEEEKEKELLIDNIEGNKEYKSLGIEAYQQFIKEIIKSQLKLFQLKKQLTVEKITISNNYSKIYAEEINKETKELKEFQKINKDEYSDAKTQRLEIFNIKEFFRKNPNLTKEQIDMMKFETKFKKGISEKEMVKREIKEIIKEQRKKKENNSLQ